MGIGAAITTRVGKKIGAGNVKEAWMVSKVAVLISTVISVIMGGIVFIFAKEIAMLYSNDPEVHKIMSECVRFVCILYVIGGGGWCAMNILEAMSKNKIQSIINVLSSWFGYVPACLYFLSGDNHKILGVTPVACIFFVGILVELFRTISLWIAVFRVDWEQCCIEAKTRNEDGKVEKKEEGEDVRVDVEIEMNERNDGDKKSIDYVHLDDDQNAAEIA